MSGRLDQMRVRKRSTVLYSVYVYIYISYAHWRRRYRLLFEGVIGVTSRLGLLFLGERSRAGKQAPVRSLCGKCWCSEYSSSYVTISEETSLPGGSLGRQPLLGSRLTNNNIVVVLNKTTFAWLQYVGQLSSAQLSTYSKVL